MGNLQLLLLIPYYTGKYENSKKRIWICCTWANVDEFMLQIKQKANVDKILEEQNWTNGTNYQQQYSEIKKFIESLINELSL